MNILFLPENVASMQSNTAAGLNKLPGVNAKVLTFSKHAYHEFDGNITFVDKHPSRKKVFKYIVNKITFKKRIKELLFWADIIHYVWGPIYKDGRELFWKELRGKKIFVEWVGSDIRNPEKLKKINPYFEKSLYNGYEYKVLEESNNKSIVQELFAKVNAIPTLCPEMSLFLNKGLFPECIQVFQRLNLALFQPQYPSVQAIRPLIIHSPTAKNAKGSAIIIETVNQLQKELDFDFKLITGLKREDALLEMKQADIFLDQIIVGSYGMASIEAMAFGKPVVCYIMPEVFEAGLPKECPIVNSNADNLENQLRKLIADANLRHELGKEGRKYVETYHDADVVARQLLKIYEEA